MFNPADSKIIVQQTNSFVGVRRNTSTEDIEFCLPIGFDDFPKDNKSAVVKLYFDLYKVFNIFAQVNQNKLVSSNTGATIDGTIDKGSRGNNKLSWADHGLRFRDEDGEIVTLYNKIPALESLLQKYNDLHIEAILLRNRVTEIVRYDKIYRYLDKAIYLEDDAPFIDVMLLPCQTVTHSVIDLVRLYCFLLSELKRAMSEEADLSHEVVLEAGVFKEKWLNSDSGLFTKSHEFTLGLLKDALYEIHRNVSLKGTDYWEIYEVVESFLYAGSSSNTDGIFCGITKFSLVWEDMCIAWAIHSQPDNIVFADTNRIPNASGIGTMYINRERFGNPFKITHFDCKSPRSIDPDLVLMTDALEQKRISFNKIFRIDNGKIAYNEMKAIELLDGETVDKPIRSLKSKKQEYSLLQRLVIRLNGDNVSNLPGKSDREHKPRNGINRLIIDRFIEELKFKNVTAGANSVTIVDCKYVSASTYGEGEMTDYSKGWKDFAKQKTYVMCLQVTKKYGRVTSEFWVPRFSNTDEEKRNVPLQEIDSRMFKRNFLVCELNFSSALKVYLMENKA